MKIHWSVPNIQKMDMYALEKVMDTGWFSMGPEVKKFEQKTASFLDIAYAIAVNNGTSALDVALKCLNIKEGDEVIIPALTYIATGNVVLYNNANPVFIDVDDTLNINTSLIEEKITDKTKALINIDLGGNPSDYKELLRISKEHDIPLIVDGAQSFGSEYHGKKCCTHGIINTTSFHSAKILTTIEGGMVFTKDSMICMNAKYIRNQGEKLKYIHQYLGSNYRMTDILAALGNSQLDRFEKTLQNRIQKAEYYIKNLKNVEYPKELPNTKNCYFFFLILVENRDKLNKFLNQNGIETRITYPIPINEQPVFTKYSKEVFPKAKDISKKIISLPIYNDLALDQQDFIIKKISDFFRVMSY
ncbi:MAG: DegT/DnrJ/EryC1/StrS family aminotransferase [Thermoplasmatales archaeon]|nr:DegT/DnrJ/EryC1/StrS family aminotransferase [Thermoplasmatales archaeon]